MFDLFAYCEYLINHLAGVTYKHLVKAFGIEDLGSMSQLASQVSGTCLIAIDGCDSDFVTPDHSSIFEKPSYSIAVIKNVPMGNEVKKWEAISSCKAILKQIMAKMLLDRRTASMLFLKDLDMGSFTINGLGPVADHFYGAIMSFTIDAEPINYQIDESYWIEDDNTSEQNG